jgi:PhnB protein
MPSSLNIPENNQAIMPYLIIAGAEDFINFTKNVFNATELMRHLRDEKLIMHAEVMINGSTIMMADATPEHSPQTCALFVYVADADITYNKALAAGATSINVPAQQSYGRSAGVKDMFGNTWWITSVI